MWSSSPSLCCKYELSRAGIICLFGDSKKSWRRKGGIAWRKKRKKREEKEECTREKREVEEDEA